LRVPRYGGGLSTRAIAKAMTKEDCRANALKCYRSAQNVADREVRRILLDLAVQWRELAIQIERLQYENIPEPVFRRGRPTLH
jgi:hypothetical protein